MTGHRTQYPFTTDLHTTRRDFLGASALGLAGLSTLDSWSPPRLAAAEKVKRHLEIVKIDRTTVRVPYRPVPRRNMDRELPHWRYAEVFEVRLKSGHVGLGETMLYYTWGVTKDEDVKRALGQNAAQLLWDDTLGAGLQMALFDAVARAADVPVYRLLGQKVHKRTPLSWWNIDTSPEDMAAECKQAKRLGYMAYKTKGRPWIDVWQQVKQSAAVVPKDFKIDMDFNDTLLDAKRAIPILKELAKYPQVGIYESPIFQNDVKGNQAIRKATRVPVAMHYGNPSPAVAVREQACDGFVIGGGASRVMRQGHFAAGADMPFWLQLVGTGITAAFSLHFGAALSHSTWPAVNCHQLYTHSMLAKEIIVDSGFAKVPERPGLGYDLDRKALARFKVAKPKRRPEPRRLNLTRWPDGRKLYIANNGRVNFMLNLARAGKMPFFEPGVKTRLVPDDGSARWKELYERARKAPVMVKG